jgi:ribonuclease R
VQRWPVFHLEKGFKDGFPPAIDRRGKSYSRAWYYREDDLAGRRDFRNIVTFTIDPIDAKDFDDAISVKYYRW